MAEGQLLGFSVGPFMVGSFALAAALMSGAFCAARGRRDPRFGTATLFTFTSAFTALYLFCESSVYAAMLMERNVWATYGYRVMTAVALVAGAGYWLLARNVLMREAERMDSRTPKIVMSVAIVAALGTLIPEPYGLLGELRIEPAQARIGAELGVGTYIYGILGAAMVTYLGRTLVRGVRLHRRAQWPLFRIAGLIGCVTAYHDLLRLLGVPLAGMPLLWMGLGLMLGVTFVLLARQHAGMTVHIEGRESEIRRLRQEQISDPTSGAFTRRVLEHMLRMETQRIYRGETQGSGVLMVAVDEYETIAERLGSAAANTLLQEIAEVLRLCVREADTIGRWEPGRFLVLLHTPDPKHARVVMERIEAATDSAHYQPLPGINIQLKLGYAQIRTDQQQQWQRVVRRAEQEVDSEAV